MKKQRTVAAITIGQSPRSDMTGDVFSRMPSDLHIVEYGALDNYVYQEASELFGPRGGDAVLVSRMGDGRQIKLAAHHADQLVQQCIHKACNEGADAILLLCTGEFPPFESEAPIISPLPLFHSVTKCLAGNKPVAVMVPDEAQIGAAAKRWELSGLVRPKIIAASPYGDLTCIQRAAEALKDQPIQFLCLDCMGYTTGMKKMVAEITGRPVLLPRTLVASITVELLSCGVYS